MADQLNKDEEDLLQSALENSFQPTNLRRVSVVTPTTASASTSVPSEQPSDPSITAEGEESTEQEGGEEEEEEWKREYDAHLSEWRARSAEQREKAELERKKWEEIRAAQKAQGKETVKEWESVSVSLGPGSTRVASPSVADSRDLVAGETQGEDKVPEVISIPQSITSSPPETSAIVHDRNNGSGEKWEDVARPSSMTSSFPSLSYPSDPHSPVSSQQHRSLPHHTHPHHHTHHEHRHPTAERPLAPATATSAIFDSSLSTKTRTLAVLSTLAINLFLPFVNGVMLGFGEIFARNVALKWFGWKSGPSAVPKESSRGPGRTAASVGLNAAAQSGPWKK